MLVDQVFKVRQCIADLLANRLAEIDRGKLRVYEGNYTTYLKKKADTSYTALPMDYDGTSYSVTVPGIDIASDLEYYISATDGSYPELVAYYGSTGLTLATPTPANDIDITIELEEVEETVINDTTEVEDEPEVNWSDDEDPQAPANKEEYSAWWVWALITSVITVTLTAVLYMVFKKKQKRAP